MQKEILYDKFNQGLSLRQIALDLNVSYNTIRYWAKKYGLKKKVQKQCIICLADLTGNQTKYCSNNCKAKAHYNKHKSNPNSYHSQTLRGLKRKMLFIKELGAACEICGYNKNLAALEFHHKDPSTKLLALDMRSLSNNALTTLRKELIKCRLLCSNCHKELHFPELFMSNVEALTN